MGRRDDLGLTWVAGMDAVGRGRRMISSRGFVVWMSVVDIGNGKGAGVNRVQGHGACSGMQRYWHVVSVPAGCEMATFCRLDLQGY
jgi:hypothetical protein